MLKTQITGETMIFKNDKGFYSTTISKKNQDGKYDNAYVNVSFKKGVDIPNKTMINITNGFLTFDKYEKDGKTATYLKIFVTDYTTQGTNSQPAPAQNDFFASSDDLPF